MEDGEILENLVLADAPRPVLPLAVDLIGGNDGSHVNGRKCDRNAEVESSLVDMRRDVKGIGESEAITVRWEGSWLWTRREREE